MFEYIRRALEPTACQVFPINLLYLPLIYWLAVFLYFLISSGKNNTVVNVIKLSIAQMFKNAFSMHPSAYFAGTALLIASVLEYVCAFAITNLN